MQFDINGIFISQFNSIKQASVGVGTSPNNISACLTKVTSTAGGYKWMYKYNQIKKIILSKNLIILQGDNFGDGYTKGRQIKYLI